MVDNTLPILLPPMMEAAHYSEMLVKSTTLHSVISQKISFSTEFMTSIVSSILWSRTSLSTQGCVTLVLCTSVVHAQHKRVHKNHYFWALCEASCWKYVNLSMQPVVPSWWELTRHHMRIEVLNPSYYRAWGGGGGLILFLACLMILSLSQTAVYSVEWLIELIGKDV
jgi:hypothetical protein